MPLYDKKCKECGESQVFARGMCRKCYSKFRNSKEFKRAYSPTVKGDALVGKTFGECTVIGVSEKKYGQYAVKAKCNLCGKEFDVIPRLLIAGRVVSCGCVAANNPKSAAFLKEHAGDEEFGYYKGTATQMMNDTINRNTTSGYRGVYRCHGKYMASIGFQGKLIYLGIYEDIQDAIKARKAAEDKYFKPIKEEFEAIYKKQSGGSNAT